MLITDIWKECLARLEQSMEVEDFNIWIRPLQLSCEHNQSYLLAPNSYVLEHIRKNFLQQITDYLTELSPNNLQNLRLKVGSNPLSSSLSSLTNGNQPYINTIELSTDPISIEGNDNNKVTLFQDSLSNQPNPLFCFKNFVEGKSNQLARAVAWQVANHAGVTYNPLFIYGGVGLGKTHLMHAVGNLILENNPKARVLYLHSERFVADMIKALQRNAMDDFKRHYRSANVLLIDDIQFFAGKDRSQEEFFHTFNSLLDAYHQIILTCDRYPKEVMGLEERLKSRFGWGLTVAIEPPDLETRVAILLSKAEQFKVNLPQEVAFFIGKRIQANVRELEGALRRVTANAHFKGEAISLALAHEALKDLLAVQAKLVSIENIQITVASFYKIKLSELSTPKRHRLFVRPRQMAMALSKELTSHSLPEIGEAFGGRDHTTVLHACRKIKELMNLQPSIREDYIYLLRILSH